MIIHSYSTFHPSAVHLLSTYLYPHPLPPVIPSPSSTRFESSKPQKRFFLFVCRVRSCDTHLSPIAYLSPTYHPALSPITHLSSALPPITHLSSSTLTYNPHIIQHSHLSPTYHPGLSPVTHISSSTLIYHPPIIQHSHLSPAYHPLIIHLSSTCHPRCHPPTFYQPAHAPVHPLVCLLFQPAVHSSVNPPVVPPPFPSPLLVLSSSIDLFIHSFRPPADVIIHPPVLLWASFICPCIHPFNRLSIHTYLNLFSTRNDILHPLFRPCACPCSPYFPVTRI